MTELETMQRAKMYLDKLSRGIDPITDREMPEDAVLNNVRICRCLHYVSGVLEQVIANGGVVGKKERSVEFSITRSQMAHIQLTSYPVGINEFAENIRAATGNPDMKRPNTGKITTWLMERGLMELVNDAEGKPRRLPSEQGQRMGMSTKMRQGQNGEYLAVYYDANIQRLILDHLEEILGA
jgi:hypothetical protein